MVTEKMIGDARLIAEPDKKYNLVIKPGTVTLDKLAVEVLNLINKGGGSGGTGVNLIDLTNRMSVDNDTITDAEIQNSLFLYNMYNRVSAIARVVEPQSGTRYALFKVSLYDEAKDGNVIAYVAYTTEDDFSESATWHYSKVLDKEDSLYVWAMGIFGDIVVDGVNDILIAGNRRYVLEQYTEAPDITYTYGEPVITSFTYLPVSADGGTVYPRIEFQQSITRSVGRGSSIDDEELLLTGTMEYVAPSLVTTYSNRSLVMKGEASVSFTNNSPSTITMDNIGAVTVEASVIMSIGTLGTVSAVLTVNGEDSAPKTATVRQNAAIIKFPDGSTVHTRSIDASGSIFRVPITKSSGVAIREIASDDEGALAYMEDGALVVEVSANASLITRTIHITVSTNVGDMMVTVQQVPATQVVYFGIGQTSNTINGFAELSEADIVDASSMVNVRSGTLVETPVAGLSVLGYYEHTINLSNSIFYLLIPSNVHVAAKLVTGIFDTPFEESDIKDSSIWRAVHEEVVIDGIQYGVYGYRDSSLAGYSMKVYVK